jgi:transcriptional regulator of acetoin/glycerol metabolism
MADEGRFNETLYYKISSLSLSIPPLRELRGDLLANVAQLLAEHRITLNAPAPFALSAAAGNWIVAQNWPGNYAQLSRILLAAARRAGTTEIDVAALETCLRQEEKPAIAAAAKAATSPATNLTPVAMPTNTAKATISAAVLSARSVFRPTTRAYDFGQRLANSLAMAHSALAS